MSRNFLSDQIIMNLSASKFLKLVRNDSQRKNILRISFLPPVLGSKSLGSYKVVLKYEQSKKTNPAKLIF